MTISQDDAVCADVVLHGAVRHAAMQTWFVDVLYRVAEPRDQHQNDHVDVRFSRAYKYR